MTLAPETEAALAASGRPWLPEYTGGSDSAYWRLLARLWADGADFTVVEQDIVVTAEALGSLDACAGDWCASRYPYISGLYAGLGCTRFRAPLMARHPDLPGVVAGMSDDTHPPQHWCRLDAWVSQVLTRRGERQCRDHPVVWHLSATASHGCIR